MSWKDKLKDSFQDWLGESKGAAGPGEGMVARDPSPISQYLSNGIFLSHPDSTGARHAWMFFRFPDDVKVEWTSTFEESADNQAFLTRVINALGATLDATQSTKKDRRIKFHITNVYEEVTGVAGYDGITPAHQSFIDRMGGFPHPVWTPYFGVELQVGDINADVYKIKDKVRNYVDVVLRSSDTDFNVRAYQSFMETLVAACEENGMKALDFQRDRSDFERLTAWFGVSDTRYSVAKELTTTAIDVPEHGMSIFAGGTEYSFSSLRPSASADLFVQDPQEPSQVRWGSVLLNPSNNVRHVNIRGEIRSRTATNNVMDDKMTNMEYKADSAEDSTESMTAVDRRQMEKMNERARMAAMMSADMSMAWLDNVEITIATEVTGRESMLRNQLNMYGIDVVNITERQREALLSTIPCYPNAIYKVPTGNKVRNPNVNNFYAGVIALSGLFRSTKPAGEEGILVGLSDSGFEYKEIYTEIDAPHKYDAPPTILVTGDTGSGKALSLSTPIPRADGTLTTMGKVSVGDRLIAPDGTTTTVTYVTPAMHDHRVFRCTYNHGGHVDADYNHQFPMVVDIDKDLIISDVTDAIKQCYHEDDMTTCVHVWNKLSCAESKKLWPLPATMAAALNFLYTDGVHDVFDENSKFSKDALCHALLVRIKQQFAPVTYTNRPVVRFTVGELATFSHNRRPREIAAPRFFVCHNVPRHPNPYLSGILYGVDMSSNQTIRLYNHTVIMDDGSRVDTYDRIVEALTRAGLPRKEAMKKTDRKSPTVVSFTVDRAVASIVDATPVGWDHSYSDRVVFMQGVCDQRSANNLHQRWQMSLSSLDERAHIVRLATSLGWVPNKMDNDTHIYLFEPVRCTFSRDRYGHIDVSVRGGDHATITLVSMREIDSVPVACLSVDHPDKLFLAGDNIPTSNTVQMIMMSTQAAYMGRRVVYLNPKQRSTLKPSFDVMGGITISLDEDALKENPGMLDPMFFFRDRVRAGQILADMIIRGMEMNSSRTQNRQADLQKMEGLKREIMDRSLEPANECSWDIIFGNRRVAKSTPRLSDDNVLEFVHNKMATSPFWRASISSDPGSRSQFQRAFAERAPILIEWGNNIVMPSESSDPDEWTPTERDAVQSVINVFSFAAEVISADRAGGLLVIDEAQLVKTADVIMEDIRKAGATWRQANMSLMLGTQKLSTFMRPEGDDDDLTPYIRMNIIMAINRNAQKDIDAFLRVVGVDNNEAYVNYITHAGRNPKRNKYYPSAYVNSVAPEWSGGVVLGPWPQREMDAINSAKKSVR